MSVWCVRSRAAVLSFAAILLSATCPIGEQIAQAEDPVFSGPQVGESLPEFELRGVYDQQRGKTFSPIAMAEGGPIVIVFVHKLTRPGFSLTRAITRYAKSLEQPKVFVAWLSDDQADAEAYLNRARKSLNLDVPVGVSPDGGEGPGAYGLNRNVELTILVGDKKNVVANFALVQPSLVDGEKVAAEIAKLVGKSAPNADTLEKLAFPNRREMMRRRDSARENEGR
ncbi:hypothetical protein LOC67_21750 [Stieleria sp. JC731]|uniref:hypothetical protein n=1 Tax=Pirellulaceae TaxID=2691357 RepID=UPI001E2CADAA|nr:hypothetical protein [Stieleria sp. JC731]MCC9603182.1 hypothetical protein [Stieleria sp. JC731]